MKKGDQIIYNGTMGGMSDEHETRFTGKTEEGQEGVYLGKYKGYMKQPHNWHMTKTLTDPPLFVPVHLSHFRMKDVDDAS